MLASGDDSAQALARSRTIDALVLKRSGESLVYISHSMKLAPHTITSHSWFSGNASGYQDNFSTGEGLLQAIGFRCVASHHALSIDMTNVSSNTYLYISSSSDHMSELDRPGAPLISKIASSVTRGFNFINRDRGCPIPPAPPKTVTLDAYSL